MKLDLRFSNEIPVMNIKMNDAVVSEERELFFSKITTKKGI